ncbi:MAG: hydantoinase/oxoprolinase family protein [Pseudomonadota bacterium]
MAYTLGVDTGGTFTDAVILRDEDAVLASAKSLTTRHDLAEGISKAVRSVLEQAEIDPAEIGLASLSTTLATNALVEDQGARVALVAIGFAPGDLERAGLGDAIKGDPVVMIGGGHDHAGGEAAPLDTAALTAFLSDLDPSVTAIALAARFATRNPAHENKASELVAQITGLPVTASHELSAKLNGPKRALTAVLNARLIGMIGQLITRAGDVLTEIGITAPLMVVRGDGALMSSEAAQAHPIETILSGPAASIVGAQWLTGADRALVSDIGGTTTDIALLQDGRPAIDPDGARVGPFRTMVEAVAMRTTGLGGDSQVHVVTEGLEGGLRLGPKRVLPVSLMATMAPDVVLPILESQAQAIAPEEHPGRFLKRVHIAGREPGHVSGLEKREAAIMERLGDEVRPVSAVLRTRMETGALNRLIDRGLVQVSGVTPSDAAHVLGLQDAWDKSAAQMALENLSRRRRGNGERLAPDARTMAQAILDQLTQQTADALLEVAFAEEDAPFQHPPATLARHELVQAGLGGHRGLVALNTALNVDVVGLGASAPTYYPAVAQRLNCSMHLPEHAGVANAIGAVVGRITLRRSGTVTAQGEGRYRVHLDDTPTDFTDAEEAMQHLEERLSEETRQSAHASGAIGIQVSVTRSVRTAEIEARAVFVEAEITAEASGRPRVS